VKVSLAWVRATNRSNFYDVGWFLVASIPSGWTYKRIRWSWGFSGFTVTTANLYNTAKNVQVAGLVTTIGNGTEVPPHPIANPNDAAPPTQRWLWWEARQPVAASVDGTADTVAWHDSGAQEIPDVQTAVLANGVPGGSFLNLWFSWQSYDGSWDTSGQQEIWYAASVLYNIP
jgi:hypothetical protein